jgi:hypothetical protein
LILFFLAAITVKFASRDDWGTAEMSVSGEGPPGVLWRR